MIAIGSNVMDMGIDRFSKLLATLAVLRTASALASRLVLAATTIKACCLSSRRQFVFGAIAASALLGIAAFPARSFALGMVGSYPVIDQIMDGSATSFALRFDGPVDHAGSGLALVTREGRRRLHARLGSRPNTLYCNVGQLPPGDYVLEWQAKAPGGPMSSGRIPFHVASP